jgi:glycerol-1-phosphate dehydrogenase [NAD(P)+]
VHLAKSEWDLTEIEVHCGDDAIARLIRYCQSRQLDHFLLVSDRNTYDALGRLVELALRERGWDVRPVVLPGAEVVADERRIVEVLTQGGGERRTVLAAGSGTITDISRYAAWCSRNALISLPTAPSMDGYASHGAALVISGVKTTLPARAPAAVFADLATLCEAPRPLIAAGFGDMAGKYVALADWKLAALLVDEPYRDDIARRVEHALADCVAHVDEIGRASAVGIAALMAGLLESGLCMAETGISRPASGSEHLFSHFWEMRCLQGLCPPALHGAKVGVGTVLAAQWYNAIRDLTPGQVAARLSKASPADQGDEIRAIRAAYGLLADLIIAEYRPFLEMLEREWPALRRRIADHWPVIREIAASVPPAGFIADLLARAGAPSTPRAIGLGENDVEQALQGSRYVRNRFTVDTVGRILGIR